MFVNTGYDKIVNLANCDEIRIDWSVRERISGTICHEISAYFGERKVLLIHFREEAGDAAQAAYEALFKAISEGNHAFDIISFIDTT